MSEVSKVLLYELCFKNPIWWIVIITGLLCAIFYKKIVGFAGEFWTKLELKKLNKNTYYIINDLMIKTNDNKTHQIDHLVISKYGIHVIETKQYNGYIVGNEYDKQWIMNRKYKINNPIHQNYGHIKALTEILNLDDKKFFNIICIPSNARIRINSSKIARHYDLKDKILSSKNEIIDNSKEIYDKLINLNIKDKKERKNHNNYANNIKKEKEQSSKNKCPKCGGNLVERKGQYGSFYGCSNYPKCKYTMKK